MSLIHNPTASSQPLPEPLIEDVIRRVIDLAHEEDQDPPRTIQNMRLVCRLWNVIIKSSPVLWTRFSIRHDYYEPWDPALRVAMDRSKDQELNISLFVGLEDNRGHTTSDPVKPTWQLLGDRSINYRLGSLELGIPPIEMTWLHGEFSQTHQALFPRLHSLSIGLRHLSSRPKRPQREDGILHLFRLQCFWRHCPSLQKLVLGTPIQFRLLDSSNFPLDGRLTHLKLRDIHEDGSQEHFMSLLPLLSRLESLDVTLAGWKSSQTIVPFGVQPLTLSHLAVTAERYPSLHPFFKAFMTPNLVVLSIKTPSREARCLIPTLKDFRRRSGFNLTQLYLMCVNCRPVPLVEFLKENVPGLLGLKGMNDVDQLVQRIQREPSLNQMTIRWFSYCTLVQAEKRKVETEAAPSGSEPRPTKRRRH